MISSSSKLQNLKQFKKSNKVSSKRKISKDKRTSKYISSKKLASKVAPNFEATGNGYEYLTGSGEKVMRTSSLESYNEAIRKQGSIGNLKMMQHMTMTQNLPTWDLEPSKSPIRDLKKSTQTQNKLKNITTHLGTGTSRNHASKGILTSGAPKSTKSKKMKSPKYFKTGLSGYYTKAKNNSVLSKYELQNFNTFSIMKETQQLEEKKKQILVRNSNFEFL